MWPESSSVKPENFVITAIFHCASCCQQRHTTVKLSFNKIIQLLTTGSN